MLATQFDLPEEHAIAMLMILRGAIAFVDMVAMQDDINELLGVSGNKFFLALGNNRNALR